MVTASEIQKGEFLIMQMGQSECFLELSFKIVDNSRNNVKHKAAKVSRFVDSGNTIILKCQLKNVTSNDDSKNLHFCSAKQLVVILIFRQMHEANQLEGTEYVKTSVQQRF